VINLIGIELVIVLPRTQFDPLNSAEPISFKANLDENIFIDVTKRVVKNFNFKSVELVDDRWDFFDESLKMSYAEIDKI
jgi:hypothetical protein